jgi:hypothetical protein
VHGVVWVQVRRVLGWLLRMLQVPLAGLLLPWRWVRLKGVLAWMWAWGWVTGRAGRGAGERGQGWGWWGRRGGGAGRGGPRDGYLIFRGTADTNDVFTDLSHSQVVLVELVLRC